MSERTDKDLERTAEEALDRLARGWDPLSDPVSSDADSSAGRDDELVASHLEALSLLAYAVEPQAPTPELRASVLRAAAAEPKVPRPAAMPTPVAVPVRAADPSPEKAPVDVTLRQMPAGDPASLRSVAHEDPGDLTLVGLGSDESPGPSLDVGDVRGFPPANGSAESSEYAPPPRAANSTAYSTGPLYLLAAGLVFCLVGLGYLYGQLQTQDAQNILRQAELQAQVQQAREDAESMRARVQMVTDVARLAYPMRQVSTGGGTVRTVSRPDPGEVRPDGIVYVCGQHQRWYLSLSGFDPAPEGKVYHLWFKTADGAIDAGPLELGDDGRADVGDLSMPEGTQGFLVSLEDATEEDGEPHGQIILKGDQPVKL